VFLRPESNSSAAPAGACPFRHLLPAGFASLFPAHAPSPFPGPRRGAQIKDFLSDIGRRPSRLTTRRSITKHCGEVREFTVTELEADTEVFDISVQAVNGVGPGPVSSAIPRARTLGA
jgi:hypothetical protein